MADVTATPNPVAAGDDYSLSGCGYDMKPVEVYRDGQFIHAIGVISTPEGNCLDNNYFPAPDEDDSYELVLKQQKGNGNKKEEKARVTLVVE